MSIQHCMHWSDTVLGQRVKFKTTTSRRDFTETWLSHCEKVMANSRNPRELVSRPDKVITTSSYETLDMPASGMVPVLRKKVEGKSRGC